VLVRPSGTEPYLRIYVESESVDEIRDRVLGVVESAIADAEHE
jgi:phosphomannomutase